MTLDAARRRLKLACVLLALLSCASQGAQKTPGPAPAGAPQQLSEEAARGRRIYLSGDDGAGGEIIALLGSEELEVPASAFACAGCHGADGEGVSEGGVQPPPINWQALNAPAVSPLTRRQRARYDETTLARAIRVGRDPSGAPLHAAMPRYRMTERQLADLVAFLKVLGTEADADAGVSRQSVRVGAALPLTGLLAEAGADVRVILEAYFAAANAQGGIYGRQIELVVEDTRGEAGETLEATRRLVEGRGVFALVGSFEPSGDAATGEYLKRQAVPSVGPLTLSPRPSAVPNPQVFYLLPSSRDQARGLVNFVKLRAEREEGAARRDSRAAPRLALIYADDEFNRDAAEGVRLQSAAHALPLVFARAHKAREFSAREVVAELVRTKAEYVFFFGWSPELLEFAREAEAANATMSLLGSALTLGRAAFELPAGVAARTYLAHPTPLPEQGDFTEFAGLARRGRAGGRHAAFQALAYAAARTFAEAVKSSGRRLSRAALVKSLEGFDKYETGVTPPLSFGPNRRLGAIGLYVVRVDAAEQRFSAVSGWLALDK